MFTNRISKIVFVLTVVVVALVTVSFATSSEESEPYLDYALRQPGGIILSSSEPIAASQGSDWYQRHRDELGILRSADTTDYFFRHPELRAARGPVDLTDYYFRHLELRSK